MEKTYLVEVEHHEEIVKIKQYRVVAENEASARQKVKDNMHNMMAFVMDEPITIDCSDKITGCKEYK